MKAALMDIGIQALRLRSGRLFRRHFARCRLSVPSSADCDWKVGITNNCPATCRHQSRHNRMIGSLILSTSEALSPADGLVFKRR